MGEILPADLLPNPESPDPAPQSHFNSMSGYILAFEAQPFVILISSKEVFHFSSISVSDSGMQS